MLGALQFVLFIWYGNGGTGTHPSNDYCFRQSCLNLFQRWIQVNCQVSFWYITFQTASCCKQRSKFIPQPYWQVNLGGSTICSNYSPSIRVYCCFNFVHRLQVDCWPIFESESTSCLKLFQRQIGSIEVQIKTQLETTQLLQNILCPFQRLQHILWGSLWSLYWSATINKCEQILQWSHQAATYSNIWWRQCCW